MVIAFDLITTSTTIQWLDEWNKETICLWLLGTINRSCAITTAPSGQEEADLRRAASSCYGKHLQRGYSDDLFWRAGMEENNDLLT
jgi:hypothetical protein